MGAPSNKGSPGNVPHGGEQIPPCHADMGEISHIPPGGMEYHTVVTEPYRLSTYTGLDDYDALFEARHCRGALMPRSSGGTIITSSIGMAPVSLSEGMTESPLVRIKPIPDSGLPPTGRKEHFSVSVEPSMMGHRVVSPVSSGHIIREGAAIFTDMTETLLTTLDQQMALSSELQKPGGSLTDNVLTSGQIGSSKVGEFQTISQTMHNTKDIYPDLYLPVTENYRISD